MSRRAWMWVAFQVAHVTLSFTTWTLFLLGFRLRRRTWRPHLMGGRRWWRGVLLTLWVFFSIGIGEELFLPEGNARLAIAYAGLAAVAWWGAWRVERSRRQSHAAGEIGDAAPA